MLFVHRVLVFIEYICNPHDVFIVSMVTVAMQRRILYRLMHGGYSYVYPCSTAYIADRR